MIARPSWFDTMLGRTSSAHVRSETGELGDHIAECPGQAFAPVDPIPTRVTDALAFNAIPEWDSLAQIELILALEAAYGVSIDEDRMIELTSVAAIRTFLKDGSAGA